MAFFLSKQLRAQSEPLHLFLARVLRTRGQPCLGLGYQCQSHQQHAQLQLFEILEQQLFCLLMHYLQRCQQQLAGQSAGCFSQPMLLAGLLVHVLGQTAFESLSPLFVVITRSFMGVLVF